MEISEGYEPGIIGVIVELHAKYYAEHHGFGSEFETKVATDLAEFVMRLDNPPNQILFVKAENRIVASVTIDGEDLGDNIAHLRWFIVDDVLRGKGAGRKLLRHALAFCDQQSFEACDLWTFKGLDSARHLYETSGFRLEEHWEGNQWGTVVEEQRFRRFRPS